MKKDVFVAINGKTRFMYIIEFFENCLIISQREGNDYFCLSVGFGWILLIHTNAQGGVQMIKKRGKGKISFIYCSFLDGNGHSSNTSGWRWSGQDLLLQCWRQKVLITLKTIDYTLKTIHINILFLRYYCMRRNFDRFPDTKLGELVRPYF